MFLDIRIGFIDQGLGPFNTPTKEAVKVPARGLPPVIRPLPATNPKEFGRRLRRLPQADGLTPGQRRILSGLWVVGVVGALGAAWQITRPQLVWDPRSINWGGTEGQWHMSQGPHSKDEYNSVTTHNYRYGPWITGEVVWIPNDPEITGPEAGFIYGQYIYADPALQNGSFNAADHNQFGLWWSQNPLPPLGEINGFMAQHLNFHRHIGETGNDPFENFPASDSVVPARSAAPGLAALPPYMFEPGDMPIGDYHPSVAEKTLLDPLWQGFRDGGQPPGRLAPPRAPVEPYRPRPPRKGEKEKKSRLVRGVIKAFDILGKASEITDAIEAVWDALPKPYKKWSFHKGKPVKPSALRMWQQIYEHWDKIPVGDALDNLAKDVLQDALIGKLSEDKAGNTFSGGKTWGGNKLNFAMKQTELTQKEYDDGLREKKARTPRWWSKDQP